MPRLRLNIVGGGHVGTSLASVWNQTNTFEIGEVFCRTQKSAASAVASINNGTPIHQLSGFKAAEIWMISTPDSAIAEVANSLSKLEIIRQGDFVFHCSGALSSNILKVLSEQGAHTASLHPAKSFPHIFRSQCDFQETYFGIEGDTAVTEVLRQSILAIQAHPINIQAENKTLYHAASVLSCNYLTTLTEISLQTLEQSGVNRETGMRLIQPLMSETLSNIFTKGTEAALTGPIQRCETAVIKKQLNALQSALPDIATIYQHLGKETINLTTHSDERKQQIKDSLCG